jgi:hypothetical protein
MPRTYRFGYRSLIAPGLWGDPHMPTSVQLQADADVPGRVLSATVSTRAQRTVARAAVALLAVTLLCTPAALADELWARDARSIHEEGFPAGVTTQALLGGGLAPDPLAPDAGTVAYIVHRAGAASASVIVYDPSTVQYRHVVTLVGPFENASDIESFDPLLRSTLRTVRERGFPARLADYTADLRTMDLAQYDLPSALRAPIAVTPAASLPPAAIGTTPAAVPRQPLTAQQTLTLLAVGGAALILTVLCLALVLFLFFRHREQMAVVRTATRPTPTVAMPPAPTMATRPAPTAPRPAPPAPRPTAVPAPPPAATQQT